MKKHNFISMLCATFGIALFIGQAAFATTYFVSPTGSDDNDGLTEQSAWAYIDSADLSNKLQPGDTVTMLPGTYDGGFTIRNCSGTASNPITYKAQGDVTINLSNGTGINVIASYIVLDGFKIKGSINGNMIDMIATIGSEVKNCRLSDGGSSWCMAIHVRGGSDNTIHNNVIGPNFTGTTFGIWMEDAPTNCRVYNNTITVPSSAIVFASVTSGSGCELKNNILFNSNVGIDCGNSTVALAHTNNLLYGLNLNYWDTSMGACEMIADPKLASDFTLTADSPAVDAGTNVGYAYNGKAPDLGAFESTYSYAGTQYYVKPGGSDSNDGLSEATAWASINHGDVARILRADDTVNVLPGIYNIDAAQFSLVNCSGIESYPITYKANGDVTLNLTSGSNNVYLTSSYTTIDGFNIKGAIEGNMVDLNWATGCEVENCKISDGGSGWCMAVHMRGGANNIIDHNLIGPNFTGTTFGVWIEDAATGHKIYNNTITVPNDAIVFSGVTTGNGFEARNNIIFNSSAGINCGNSTTPFTHTNNIFYGVGLNYWNTDMGANEYVINPQLDSTCHLQSSSPAIDSGTDLGYAYNGLAPDLGAFESSYTQTAYGSVSSLPKTAGSLVKLSNAVVTIGSGVLSGNVIYVEDANRVSGIKVVGTGLIPALVEGDVVSISGNTNITDSGELEINATDIVKTGSVDPLRPFGMPGKSVASNGLDNSGLFVKTWGNVSYVDPNGAYFCLNDGSATNDGLGHNGVAVVVSDLASAPTVTADNAMHVVIGFSGHRNLGGGVVPVVVLKSIE